MAISLAPGIASAACPSSPLGDLTADGELRLDDAVRLWRIVRGFEAAGTADSLRGDCAPRPGTDGRAVGDGVLDAADVDRLLDRLLGRVDAAAFHVTPTVDAFWPRSVAAGDTVPRAFAFGSGFAGICSLGVAPAAGVRFTALRVVTDSLLEATLVVDSTATPGTRPVHAHSPAGTSPEHADAQLLIHPPSGPPVAFAVAPATLQLVAGSSRGHLNLWFDATPEDSTTATVSSADPAIAAVPSWAGIPVDAEAVGVAVVPKSVGTTTITIDWQGLSAQASIQVVAAALLADPPALDLFQAGLLDSITLVVTPQAEDCSIALESSDPGVAGVPPAAVVPAGGSTVRVGVTPGLVAGDVTITARLSQALGATEAQVAVHVEPLRLTLIAAEAPVTLQDDVVKDNPGTPDVDEGLGIGTSGVILALNGASRFPQSVSLSTFPEYVPGLMSGFATLPSAVIPPHQTFWAHHFGGIIEGAGTPPVGGLVRARLDLNPVIEEVLPALMSYGPPARQALRFCDAQVDYVPGMRTRTVVVIADQANTLIDERPDWGITVNGLAVQVDTLTNDTRAALFLNLTPLQPGVSRIIVTCSPGLSDTLYANVLGLEMFLTTGTSSEAVAPGEVIQSEFPPEDVVETDGLKVTQLAAVMLAGVRLTGATNARGTLYYGPVKDRFVAPLDPRPDEGPDIAAGSTPVLGAAQTIDITADPLLRSGQLRTLVWDFRDGGGNVVRPGRYVFLATAIPPPRDRGADATDAILRSFRVAVAVNMAQVVWLKFNEEFRRDLQLAGGLGPGVLAMGQVAGLVEGEFHQQDSVNVRVTVSQPSGVFDYTTLEIGGGDPHPVRTVFGRARFDLCNQIPDQAVVRSPSPEGVFPREIYGFWANLRATGTLAPQQADFDSIFRPTNPSNHDRDVATEVFSNYIASVAIHELGHSLGLVPGPDIADFGNLEASPPYGPEDFHNAFGRAYTGPHYMDSGAVKPFREMAMISGTATHPFGLDEIGMEPNDFSMRFNDVNLKYLRRLLPRGGTVR